MLPVLKRVLKEDGEAPTNSVSGGGVAGLTGDPPGGQNILARLKRKSVEEEPEEKKLPPSSHNPYHQTLLNHGFTRDKSISTPSGETYIHHNGKHFIHVMKQDKIQTWHHFVPSRDPNYKDHQFVREGKNKGSLETHLKNYGIKDEEALQENKKDYYAVQPDGTWEKNADYRSTPIPASNFAGHPVFDVDSNKFYHCRMGKRKFAKYECYVGNDEVGERIRQYGRKNPHHPVILRDENTKALLFLRYGRGKGPKF